MAIAATMSHNNDEKDDHDHDMVMPGFRFHPTEEELIEFYLRRKVEGKRFNVELITFLDLYRYDPWELPALAAIGEKEWFFYVPRDRKYRNGDRPNRVTTSGYWKATGADRTIRTENGRSIGLKKTLVFYSGKAPKGIRTSWIMNEYRLPQHETDRNQKAEISLCRVYKRAGVDDHSPVVVAPTPSLLSSVRPSSSSYSRGGGGGGGGGIIESHSKSESEGKQLQSNNNMVHCSIAPPSFQGIETTVPPVPTDNRLIDHHHHHGIWTALGLANHHRASPYNEVAAIITTPPSAVSVVEEEAGDREDDEAETLLQQHHSVNTKQVVVGSCSLIFPPPPLPPCIATSSTHHPHHFFKCSSSSSSTSSPVVAVDELRRLVDYQHVAAVAAAAAAYSEQQRQQQQQQQQQAYNFLQQQQQPLIVPSESHLLPPPSFHHQHHQEKLWEWRSTTSSIIPGQSNPENTDQDFPITGQSNPENTDQDFPITTTTTTTHDHQFK